MSVQAIEEENKKSFNHIYRLLKRYNNLRNTIHELRVTYMDVKIYPLIPRYFILKDMIKNVLRHPSYMEVYHEDIVANSINISSKLN